LPRRLKRALPWILSLGILLFLLLTTDVAAIAAALESADWGRLVGFMALVTALSFLVDAATIVPLMRRFVLPLRYREVVAIKGVSYFLNVLNYSAAAAGMAWVIHKRHTRPGVPFMRVFSALVWFFFVDIIALGIMLVVGWLLARDTIVATPFYAQVPIVIAVVFAVVVGALVYWNGRFDFVAFGFFRKWRLFQVFGEARLRDYAPLVAMRIGFICVYVLMHWLLLPAFGVHIPFWMLLMYSPLITFVQVIPANVSGLGAVQGVMVGLFAAHVAPDAGDPKAVIIAYSTVIGPLMTVMRLVIGYCFVATIARDVLPNEADIDAVRQSEEGGAASEGSPTNAVGTNDT